MTFNLSDIGNDIQAGDYVNIYWEYCPCEFNVKVTYKPQSENEWWVCVRSDNTPIYVKNFSKIELVKAK